jgi:hypothetical protein
MTRTEKLTQAFNTGYAHGRANGTQSRRLRVAQNVRSFWEAGYDKAIAEVAAEYAAWLASPEGKRQENKRRQNMRELCTAMSLCDQGRWEEANDVLNANLRS